MLYVGLRKEVLASTDVMEERSQENFEVCSKEQKSNPDAVL
jgi:hypothetical protein